MFAVDGHQFCAGSRTQRLHYRCARDQALLVGKCQTATELQCSNSDREPSEPDNPIHDHVGNFGKVGEVADDFRERQRGANLCPTRRIGDRYNLRAKLECLLNQYIDGSIDAECDDLVAVALGT